MKSAEKKRSQKTSLSRSRLYPSLPQRKKISGDDKQYVKKIRELETLVGIIARAKYMWESTFDAITDPVMIISRDYKIMRANLASSSTVGMDVRTFVGKTCYQVFAGRNSPCAHCPLISTLDTGLDTYSSLKPFSNTNRQYNVHAYNLKMEDGKTQAVLHYREVTKEKELQRRLFHSEKMGAIGTLAGGVAHEINNPLGGILAFAQLVSRNLPADHPCQNDLKEIQDATLRCKKIVQDLLDFSRLGRDETMEAVNINSLLEKISPLLEVQLKTSKLNLKLDLDARLPRIFGSPSRLQQVFFNLIANGFQAMKEKGGKLCVKTYFQGEEVFVSVEDEGTGISEENLGKIFDPYFTTKTQGEGTGLGLSITYSIVKDHGGKIEVKSVEGMGTTFVLSFPAFTQGDL